MSTATESAKLATIGIRFRASYLVQQAGYTLGIASAEGEPLAALLPTGHLAKATQLRDDVDKAAQDKTIRAAEAKQSTATQNQHMHEATVWIRKVGKRCQSAVQLGAALPPELTRTSSPFTVPGMLEQMNKTLALLGQHSAAMDALGPATKPLIEQGSALMQTLQQADTAQEQARSFDLPASVEAFYVKKGELYTALKIINNAGHELYAHDLPTAAKFNLSILHRRAPQPATPEPPPAPHASAS
jgi:hypothetical protein